MALRDGKDKLSPTFARIIQQKVVEMGYNPRTFAGQVLKRPYDPFRKVHNGETFPGPMLIDICNATGLNYEEMKEVVENDKDITKGKISFDLLEALDKDAEVVKLGAQFKRLDDKNKKKIMNMIHNMTNNPGYEY